MLATLLRHLDMVHLSVPALAVLALVGCSGLIDGDGSLSAEEVAAREAFTGKAKPVFDSVCAACHAGSDPSIAFLMGGDAMAERKTLLTFDPSVVDLDAPQSSRVLTKREHSGPAMTPQQSADVLEWISAEHEAAGGGVDAGLATARFSPLLCTSGSPGTDTCPINHVDLTGLLEGWAGARINFVAQPLSEDLYVTNLGLEGGPDGVYLEHPLFASWPPNNAAPIPDTLDRFFNVKLNIASGAIGQAIGGGTAAFINFTPTNELTIHFKVLDKFRVDGPTDPTMTQAGCKKLTEFKANAKTPMQNNCASCHAGTANANARAAMDLTGIAATDDATLQTVCDQARTRINFTDTNQSGFFIAPNPSQATAHPFKFGGVQANFDAFKTAIDPWVQAEKTAQ